MINHLKQSFGQIAILGLTAFGLLSSINLNAQVSEDIESTNESKTIMMDGFEVNTDVYPFKPLPTEEIVKRSTKFTQNEGFIWNLLEMDEMNLNSKNLTNRPWSGSYWPMNMGLIANNYSQNRMIKLKRRLLWKNNYLNWLSRSETYLQNPDELSEYQLNLLAPSEKYDLVMGHKNFDLTKRIWDYVHRWGYRKKYGFLYSIDLPDLDYELETKSDKIGLWEGICHGWATAAGIIPRPEKTVEVPLENGKKVKFYPHDIKGLVSLLWANSTLQDHMIMEGYRCNQGFFAKKDPNGRYIDPEPKNDVWLPRCADVHPGILHIALTNLIGLQDRSFVVDVSSTAKVSNQPIYGFSSQFFNLRNYRYSNLSNSLRPVGSFYDPFESARNKDTKYIVGVKTTLKYVDWKMAVPSSVDKLSYDKVKTKKFYYDLELDKDGNIIGGQWRTSKKSKPLIKLFASTHQPDFIWTVPRNWKDFMIGNPNLENWENTNNPVPATWKDASKVAHQFLYRMTKEYGWNEKCVVYHRLTGKRKEVPCEFEYPRPQPLTQFVNKLIELSSSNAQE